MKQKHPSTNVPPEFATRFMVHASQLYTENCPELSCYFMHEARVSDEKKSVDRKAKLKDVFPPGLSICEHCCQPILADSLRVRLIPRRRPAARELSVLHREARGKRLSLAQRDLLARYRRRSSAMMATCHTCNKTTRYSGISRDHLMALTKSRGHPGSSSSPMTPQGACRSNTSTPKSAGKDKTPRKTPRPVSSTTPASTSSSSSKSPVGVKKWVVQRLSKILHRDQKADKKGTLKEFLSSL